MTTTLNADDLSFWESQFDSADPMAVTTAAEKLAKFKSEVPLDFRFTMCDKLWRRVGELGGDLIEGSGTDPRNNVPTATIKLKGSSPHISTMMGCHKEMVGVKLEIGGSKQAFYIDKHKWAFDKAWTGTAELKGIWDLLFWWVIWPQWYLPIQAQPISHAVFVAPIVTAIEAMLSQCATRLQSGLNEFFNNALSLNPDMRAWFGTLLQSNGNIAELLKTPAYVVRHNPLLDTSPLIARTVRMETCGAVIRDLAKPYGVDVEVTLWEPGDAQPDQFANLDQPTYVIRVTDRSQVVGPTKTIIDSVLRTAVDVQGSFFGDLFGPLLGRQKEIAPDGVFTAPNIGVDCVAPYAIIFAPEAGGKSPLATCEIVDHTPKGWQHIIGGRSPKWAGAPSGNWGGTGPRGLLLTQRHPERHIRLADRFHLDSLRNHRCAKQFAGRPAQRLVFRVRPAPALRAPRRHGALPPQHGAIPRHRLQPLQRGGDIHLPQYPLGQ